MNRSLTACLGLLAAGLIALPAAAATPWLIATTDESARGGAPIAFEVVKPDAEAQWPATLGLRVIHNGASRELTLTAAATAADADANAARRLYLGTVPGDVSGLVRVELADGRSNRLALLVAAADGAAATRLPPDATLAQAPLAEMALSVNEPVYFLFGAGSERAARFQLSVKYRLFDADAAPVKLFPLLSGLYFGYTQNSIWELGADSSPFRDTNYRPSLFWQGVVAGDGLMPQALRAGYEHESNGRDGVTSRSINTLFAQPVWRTAFADGRTLVAAPKLYGYLTRRGNEDIQRYRGNVDAIFRYGYEAGWLATTQLRRGTAGHGSAQFDLSYPLRRLQLARTGGFLHFQLFKGYGESLLDYNVRHGSQFRIGFSVVR